MKQLKYDRVVVLVLLFACVGLLAWLGLGRPNIAINTRALLFGLGSVGLVLMLVGHHRIDEAIKDEQYRQLYQRHGRQLGDTNFTPRRIPDASV